jgi:hypothetical protein
MLGSNARFVRAGIEFTEERSRPGGRLKKSRGKTGVGDESKMLDQRNEAKFFKLLNAN